MFHRANRQKISRKSELLILSCFIALAWLGALPYSDHSWLRLIAALPGGFLLNRAVRKWFESRQLLFMRVQFKWLLEHLISRLSSGATLERALMDASASLGMLLGRQSNLLTGLRHLEQQLAAHQPLDLLLPQLGQYLPCPEAMVFFQVLPGLRQAGGQINQYARQQLKMTMESLTLQQDLNAETVQRQTEALILAITPFILTGLLHQTGDLFVGEAAGTAFGVLGMWIAYGLAMFGAILTLSLISFNQNLPGRQISLLRGQHFARLRVFRVVANFLLDTYKHKLPEAYGARLLQILQDQANVRQQGETRFWQAYFESKAVYLIAGLLPGILLTVAEPWLCFSLVVIPLVIILLQDQQVFLLARKRQIEYQLDYPVFLNLISALLHAGISLHMALDVGLKSLPAEPAGRNQRIIGGSLQNDLLDIRKQLRVGRPASMVIENMAERSPISEVQSALLLLVRYDRTGGPENLQLLQMQTAACWSLHRNTARKKLEKQSLGLLLPMALDLISVMLTAIMPALQSLQSI